MGNSNSIKTNPNGETMEAIVFEKYGNPELLKKSSIPKPHGFCDDEVLIKVHAASINPVDKLVMHGDLALVLPVAASPHVICYDVAGEVEVADKAGKHAVGDAVFSRLFSPAPGVEAKTPWFRGSMAQYCVARAEDVVKKPTNITFEEAASIPLAGMTAYQVLKSLKGGEKVFISGGAGGVGSLAIQLAKHVFGAKTVVTTASPGAKTDLCKSLGADEVVDYRSEKFEDKYANEKFDFCFDTTGESLKMSKIVKEGGKIVTINGTPTLEEIKAIGGTSFILSMVIPKTKKRIEYKEAKKIGADWRYLFLRPSGADLTALSDALATGKIKAVLDGTWSFAGEEWRDAFTKQFSGRATGKCVVKMV